MDLPLADVLTKNQKAENGKKSNSSFCNLQSKKNIDPGARPKVTTVPIDAVFRAIHPWTQLHYYSKSNVTSAIFSHFFRADRCLEN